MIGLREVEEGTRRGGRYNGTCGVRLAVFWRGVLLLPRGCCTRTFSCVRSGWNRSRPGRNREFLFFDVEEVFWVVFRK